MFIYDLLTEYGRGISREGLLNVVGFVFALVFALTFHEVAHGVVALWNGDNTAKVSGRLSLNPAKHFDLMGLVFMLLVGFGWAKPVPVNPYNFKNRKLGAVTVSVAGVATNFLLAFLFALPVVLLQNVEVQINTPKYYALYCLLQFCYFMVVLNINFGLFNILPLYPLDGYRLLSCLVNERNGFMTFLRRYSFYIMLVLIALSYIPIVGDYSPLYLYIGWVGGEIQGGFFSFWGLLV